MKIFILALLFGIVLVPIMDGFTNLILTIFEMFKSYLARVINRNNQLIQEISNNEIPKYNKIGFDLSQKEEEK